MNDVQIQNLKLMLVNEFLKATGTLPVPAEIDPVIQYIVGPKPSAILPAKIVDTGAGKAIVA